MLTLKVLFHSRYNLSAGCAVAENSDLDAPVSSDSNSKASPWNDIRMPDSNFIMLQAPEQTTLQPEVVAEWLTATGFSSATDAVTWLQSTCYDRVSQAVLPLGVTNSADMLLLQPQMVDLPTIPVVFRKKLALILKNAVTADQQVKMVLSKHTAWLDDNLGASTPGKQC